MEDVDVIELLVRVLESKDLTTFEKVQIEEVLASIEDRMKNPVLNEDLPEDQRKKKYHAVYKKRVGK